MDDNVQQGANVAGGMYAGLPPEHRVKILEEQLKQLVDLQSEARFRYSAVELAVRCVQCEPNDLVNLAKQIEKYLKGPGV